MEKIRKDLKKIRMSLSEPVNLQVFISSIVLPQDEASFEFSYFKTSANILEIIRKENPTALILGEKEKVNYRQITKQKIILSNPEDEKDTFEVSLNTFSNGVMDHHFLQIIYDREIFFVDRADGTLLIIPIFA